MKHGKRTATDESCHVMFTQLETIRRNYERIIATSKEHISIVDRHYVYQMVNDAYLQAHGKRREEIVGHGIPELLGQELFTRLVKERLDQAFAGREIRYQEWFPFKNGRRYMDVLYLPLIEDDGGVSGVAVNSRDITELEQAREALSSLNTQLEERVRQRTDALSQANSLLQQEVRERRLAEAAIKAREKELRLARIAVEKASRAKNEFLSNLSHELRTPLNAVIGFAELLRDGIIGQVTDEQRSYLNDIVDSGHHHTRQLNDILDLVAAETGTVPIKREPVCLAAIFSQCGDALRKETDPRGIMLHWEIAPDLDQILTDSAIFRKIMRHLLDNAVKFSPDGGTVTIGVTRKDSDLRISVADSGIGINEADLPRLFKPFSQLDASSTKRYPGLGLGLNLCRKYSGLLGGGIEAESSPGQGSRFTLVLPYQRGGNGEEKEEDNNGS